MFGWLIRLRISISRWKRSGPSTDATSARSTLSATFSRLGGLPQDRPGPSRRDRVSLTTWYLPRSPCTISSASCTWNPMPEEITQLPLSPAGCANCISCRPESGVRTLGVLQLSLVHRVHHELHVVPGLLRAHLDRGLDARGATVPGTPSPRACTSYRVRPSRPLWKVVQEKRREVLAPSSGSRRHRPGLRMGPPIGWGRRWAVLYTTPQATVGPGVSRGGCWSPPPR